jgi:branched-chain amino acid transport system substrate-binding protein
MKITKTKLIIAFTLLTVFCLIEIGRAEIGVTDQSIKVGTVVDTTGPLTFYGSTIKAAIEAYFKMINAQGGIYGRRLELVQESDNYEPARSVAALKKIITRDRVFCFISNMGTGSVMAQVPIIEEEKIPLIGPVTSAAFVKEPPKKYIFPTISTYDTHGMSMIDYIFNHLKISNPKIGLIGSESLGPLVEAGMEKEIKKFKSSIEMKVRFPDKEVDFSSHVIKLQKANVDPVVIVGIYGQTAKVLLEMQKLGWKPTVIVNASAADPKLLELSGAAGEGAFVQMAFAMYTDEAPGIREYRELMTKYAPDSQLSNFAMWGGFISAKLLAEGLRRTGKDVTREKLVNAMETITDFKTDVFPPISYGPKMRAGASGAYYAKIEGGKLIKVKDWIVIK